tara:strand:- start:14651 stop:15268 length:618 start_codon:yes stop_codon:yes gene_type:complete
MNFDEFHTLIRSQFTETPIRFSDLRLKVHAYHRGINVVKLYPYDMGKSGCKTAHYVLKDQPENDMRESAHDVPCFNAEIRFCETLKDEHNDFNFVMTKELMHVFDTENQRVSNAHSFKKLLRDAENRPPPGASLSEEFYAEHLAYWRALVILCPIEKRDRLKVEVESVNASQFDVSEAFLIRNTDVSTVLSDNFIVARNYLLRLT